MNRKAIDQLFRNVYVALVDEVPGHSDGLLDVLGERLGAALRRGWDSTAPTTQAPVEPATHAATRALVDRLTAQLDEARARIAELEAELAGMRVERIGSAGECVTGDGVRWSVVPGRGPTRADYVFVTVGITEDGDDSNVAGIPVASLLRACGRDDL